MFKSESIVEISKAMAKAQGEVKHAALDSKNPHFKSEYASLESCLNEAKPVMEKHGLSLIQSSDRTPEGDLILTSLLAHESGEWIQFQTPLVLTKQDMQGLGSAISYAKRYALCGIMGMGSEDDDGNAASQTQESLKKVQNKITEYTIPFGKFKGKAIDSVPLKELCDYVDYISSQPDFEKKCTPVVKDFVDRVNFYEKTKAGK